MRQKWRQVFRDYFGWWVIGLSVLAFSTPFILTFIADDLLPALFSVVGAIAFVYAALHTFWLQCLTEPEKKLGHPKRQVRQRAFEQLLAMGRQAVPIFLQTLSAPRGQTGDWNGDAARRLAAEGLGRLKSKEAVDALIELLDDPDATLRAKAAWALGEIGDQRAVPALIPSLGDTEIVELPPPQESGEGLEVSRVCDWTANALRKLGEGDLVEAFAQVLKNRQETEGLARLKGHYRHQVIAGFLKALESSFSRPASNAAWALGELKALEAMPKLEAKARSVLTDKEVRLACRQAIAKLAPLAKLPRAAEGMKPDIATLPKPARASEVSKDTLPRSAISPDCIAKERKG